MRFPLILLASVAVVGGLVWTFVSMNRSGLVTLEGSILKVRTYALTADSTLVFADFRITNPTRTPFVVDSVEMFVERRAGQPIAGDIFSRADVERVFAYQKIAGPKYNEPLIVSNRIAPGETLDRMSVGRVDMLESEVEARLAVRVRIHEFNGQVAEIVEAPQQK